MNFADLLNKYNSDITITKENIQQKLYDVPVYHGIYSKYLYQWRRRFLKLEQEKNKIYRERYYFYKDKFERSLDEKSIKWHIETDEEYMNINERYQVLKYEVEQIQQMVEYCSKLSFFCGNIINYLNFINGR